MALQLGTDAQQRNLQYETFCVNFHVGFTRNRFLDIMFTILQYIGVNSHKSNFKIAESGLFIT